MARNRNANVSMEQGINRIVEGTVVEGAIHSESSIRIDGRFVGDIRTSGRLVIGSTGFVKGTVECADCESEGRILGHLRVTGLLSLKATAEVEGEIRYGRMAVEAGARIDGLCKLDSGEENELTVDAPRMTQVQDEGLLQQTA
tara:strand:+ start:1188 stop:1616 length:429 start_codon:yes stop_codon:yes gene_type:complete